MKKKQKWKIKIRNNKIIGMNVKNYKAKSGNKVAKKLKKTFKKLLDIGTTGARGCKASPKWFLEIFISV